jgi:hypothetical protein
MCSSGVGCNPNPSSLSIPEGFPFPGWNFPVLSFPILIIFKQQETINIPAGKSGDEYLKKEKEKDKYGINCTTCLNYCTLKNISSTLKHLMA